MTELNKDRNTFFKRCMYKDCINRQVPHGKHLYRFPAETDGRQYIWIRYSGNRNLETWSATTVRRAGLCENHFTPESFNPKSARKALKRDALPIPYDSIVAEKSSNESEEKRKNLNEIEPHVKENMTGPSDSAEMNVELFTSNSDDLPINEQLFQKPPLKTYKSPHLKFQRDIPAGKDVIEWAHIEPPVCEGVLVATLQNNANSKESEKNKENNVTKKLNSSDNMVKSLKVTKKLNSSDIMVESLKAENVRLRNILKRLKYRMRKAKCTQKYGQLRGRKQKKNLLKKLIDEQDLHPVAKTMINLQLHTSHEPYTEEEKNLSKQLYCYSPSTFCYLKRAGCNFPGGRTMRRWLEECNTKPELCDVIDLKD